MKYDFDQLIPRRSSDSMKWNRYPEDVLPLWVADMDFVSPLPVIDALRQRVDHGIFGYGEAPAELRQVFVERMWEKYRWQVSGQDLVFLPGVVSGFNLACRATARPGQGVLVQTPVYAPILKAAVNNDLVRQEMVLRQNEDGRYVVDLDDFEDSVNRDTRIFILCNPHNPIGRAFTRQELEQMAQVCLRHDVIICSDEIHNDLLFSGTEHLPIASLGEDIADRCITLLAPSKTYNIAGLQCSVAVIQNEALRRKYLAAMSGIVPGVGVMGYTAALAGYKHGREWLQQVMAYLETNRDVLVERVNNDLSGIHVCSPEATYLAWLDCRELNLPMPAQQFFLERARLAFSAGESFGRGGEGFVRMNFGCPLFVLTEALDRMQQALAGVTYQGRA